MKRSTYVSHSVTLNFEGRVVSWGWEIPISAVEFVLQLNGKDKISINPRRILPGLDTARWVEEEVFR